jgi:hypothetical protein
VGIVPRPAFYVVLTVFSSARRPVLSFLATLVSLIARLLLARFSGVLLVFRIRFLP